MSNKARPFDVFISHSTKDTVMASAMKQHLQERGIRCWKAPDDILPGESWPTAITRALSNCRVMVLIWSGNSMSSHEVSKELTLAMRNNLTVIPFRIENIAPVGEWDYHLVNTHWMDAHDGVMDEHLDALGGYLLGVLPDRALLDEGYAKKETETVTRPGKAPVGNDAVKRKSGIPAGLWIFTALFSLVLLALAVAMGSFFISNKREDNAVSHSPVISAQSTPMPQPVDSPAQQISAQNKQPEQNDDSVMFDVRSGYAAQLAKMIRESQIESLTAVNGTGAFSAKIDQLRGEAAQQDKIAESSAAALQEIAQKEKSTVIQALQTRENEIQQAATDPKAAVKAAAALDAFKARIGISDTP